VLIMKKPDTSVAFPGGSVGFPDDEFAALYPTVVDYLVSSKYDDGSARSRSSVSLFVEDGCVKLSLNDKDTRRTLYVASQSVDEAFKTLEAALQVDNPPWRSWKGKK